MFPACMIYASSTARCMSGLSSARRAHLQVEFALDKLTSQLRITQVTELLVEFPSQPEQLDRRTLGQPPWRCCS